jgi:microcystin-dependent protein
MPFLTPNTVPTNDFVCRVIRIPNDPAFVWAVSGALIELTKRWNWEVFGEMTPDEMAQASVPMVEDFLESDACMIGMMQPFIGNTPPANALICNGSVHQRADYPRFYDLAAADMPILIINETSFFVPDMRNYSLIGAGSTFPHGSFGGSWERTLTVDQMPEHTHTSDPHTHGESTAVPAIINGGVEAPASAATPGAGTTGATAVTIQPAGGGEPFSLVPRHVALNYIVWVR